MSEPANLPTIAKKNALKKIYKKEAIFKSEVDKVFPKDDTIIYECTNVKRLLSENGINAKFNKVFLAREPAIKIGTNENAVHVYRDEIGVAMNRKQNRSIIIVCTACVIKEDNDYKIVIASRLDTRHREDEKTMKGGSSTEAKNIFKYIENNLNNNVISADVLNEGELNPDFINKMSDPLTSFRNTEFITPEFIEYKVKKTDVDIKSLTFNKIINFKVTFCIIYDENSNNIYYSTTFDQNTIYTISGDRFNGNYKKTDATAKAAPRAEEVKAAAGLGSGSTTPASHLVIGKKGGGEPLEGGGKRKLTRKQLNIMTLTELKQLHKVNKIKMNNNRTIKALINNYIKK